MNIVEYNHSYAAAVAKMWNMSNSSWGNDDSLQTEQDVINRESNSGNIKLYLAIDNDEVVGYCSFSEYQQDEGASYLPLLNVRPDYHGKKVGKALILKVLEDAVASKWSRFDLYTWSGNIKAMPLYKKCGFFWEKDNERVHLMNFIPYLFQTTALTEYLTQIDWYQDSKRTIDMNQDGREEDGYDYYRYDFENEKTKLAFEFERSGRGLRMIETPDYKIVMTVPKKELVYNESYKVEFIIENKTNKPLNVDIKCINNKNITFESNTYVNVEKEEVVSLPFFVGKIKKAQLKNKTHPVVEANLYINGKKATFKVGIEPKSPLEMKLITGKYNHNLSDEYKGYLNIENNLDHKETFNICLPDSIISFKKKIEVTLDSKQKKSVKAPYTVSKYGIYNENAVISYGKNTIKKQLHELVKGPTSTFGGVLEAEAFLVSGNFALRYDLNQHNIILMNAWDVRSNSAFLAPQIGSPFSLEFSNSKPEIAFPDENYMTITYTSKTFKDVKVIVHARNEFGLVTLNYELLNEGPKRKLGLQVPIWHRLSQNYVPYNGSVLELEFDGADISNLYQEKLDENWLYDKKNNFGLIWDKELNVTIAGWRLHATVEDIELDTDGSYRTPDFILSYIHPNLKNFREFIGYYDEDKAITEYMDIKLNDGNPFASKDVSLKLSNTRKYQIAGTIEVADKSADIEESITVSPGVTKATVNLKDRVVNFEKMLFEVKGKTTLKEEGDSLIVNNGVIEYKVSNDYSDSVYSLMFDGHEWLDSNYPEPKERVWWGTFTGGINFRTYGVQDIAVLPEKRTAEFIEMKDNFGNNWQGVKISVTFEKEENLKGFTFDTYNLTLPGVPLLYSFTNVINDTGRHQNRGNERYITLKADDDKTKVTFKKGNTTYKCGDVGVEEDFKKLFTVSSTRDYKLNIYNRKNELLIDSQTGYTILFSEGWLTVPDGESKQFPGDFIFFTKEEKDKKAFKDLENIKFEV